MTALGTGSESIRMQAGLHRSARGAAFCLTESNRGNPQTAAGSDGRNVTVFAELLPRHLPTSMGARDMLWTIAVILLVLWALGFLVFPVVGGLIHILLVTGRRAV
jgi:hypothetical protein